MRGPSKVRGQLFPLRTCSITIDGTLERPCIQYSIHRCNAPCTGWETREGYAKTVREVTQFLGGRDEDLALRLTREMEEAAVETKFERAAALRNQIQALNKVRERQKIISTDEVDQDVIGVVRQGSDESEEHTSELQSQSNLVCRLLLEKKKSIIHHRISRHSNHNYYNYNYLTYSPPPTPNRSFHFVACNWTLSMIH